MSPAASASPARTADPHFGASPEAPPLRAIQAPTRRKSMNFGEAIEILKRGGHVARAGWNGKGMWIALVDIHGFDPTHGDWTEDLAMAAMEDTHIDRCLILRTAGETYQPGWNASTPDVLAEDWEEVRHPVSAR